MAATCLQRRASTLARFSRQTLPSSSRLFASDSGALVEVPGEAAIVAQIPEQQRRRRVVIYSPARAATQQGSGKVGRWFINFLSVHKWENPLMGWTSTADPYANVGDAGLSFDSAEAAIAFAEKHGWEYSVKKFHAPILKPKSYADNFKWKGPAPAEDHQ
ncbi:unnamed protein product [Linum trigynum]|uniref:NADH dehydrogenase [ubiquinone] iron-sulfur protein 4, mitochondrial n=1 Tax=Linum trigynum TaxID=586398 RepID=A0AAV2FBZ0_9ROSI